MRDVTIARNYAVALLELARKGGDLGAWGALIGGLADAIGATPTLRLFLESPRISAGEKSAVLEASFRAAPRSFVLFLHALVRNRRQMLIPEISAAYSDLVDEVEGRIHAMVTVARETGDAEREAIAKHLSRTFGKDVVPHLLIQPEIMGGVVVRVGDTVMDGSVRRRLGTLRAAMLGRAAGSA
jgi:F-type H+-transporting ATPase subunit delta